MSQKAGQNTSYSRCMMPSLAVLRACWAQTGWLSVLAPLHRSEPDHMQTLLDRLRNVAHAWGYRMSLLRPWYAALSRLAAELGLEEPVGALPAICVPALSSQPAALHAALELSGGQAMWTRGSMECSAVRTQQLQHLPEVPSSIASEGPHCRWLGRLGSSDSGEW